MMNIPTTHITQPYPKRSVKKNTGYKIVFGNSISWNGEQKKLMNIYTDKEFYNINTKTDNSINITLDEDDWIDLQNIDKKLHSELIL